MCNIDVAWAQLSKIQQTVRAFLAGNKLPKDKNTKKYTNYMGQCIVFANLCKEFPGVVGWKCNTLRSRQV